MTAEIIRLAPLLRPDRSWPDLPPDDPRIEVARINRQIAYLKYERLCQIRRYHEQNGPPQGKRQANHREKLDKQIEEARLAAEGEPMAG